MQTLTRGAHGDDVRTLQAKLAEKGFSPGALDGDFGPGTEAAVVAFQQSAGLVADGVAGPRTAAALGLAPADAAAAGVTSAAAAVPDPAPPGEMPAMTVAIASRMVAGAPLDNIRQNLPLVLEELANAGLTSPAMVLTAIATIGVETGRFAPIGEYVSQYNTSPGGRPFDRYDFRGDLGNGAAGDGAKYKGRGFVQLTGRANYLHFGPLIGVPDLADNPDQANEPSVAAKLLAAFLKATQNQIEDALANGDFARARRAVNGGSHGLAEFTRSYQTGAALLGYDQ